DGVPLSQSSAILVLNVSIYTLGLLVIGLLALFIRPDFYTGFAPNERLCFWLGLGFHGLLILACLLFMFSKRTVLLVGNLVIRLLSAMHIFKDRDAKLAAYRASIANYRACVQIIRENPAIIFRLLFYSVMQRVLLMPITYLTFLACGVEVGFMDTLVMQAYCTVGASAIPLPGAVGISETLFVDMFSAFPAFEGNTSLLMYVMILSRSVSGYLAIAFCGYITMSHHIRSIVRAGRTDAETGEDPGVELPEAEEIVAMPETSVATEETVAPSGEPPADQSPPDEPIPPEASPIPDEPPSELSAESETEPEPTDQTE
ncbi:MAG: flippase-like domain-containing protein, partial [Clostridia bacterium]|nr:flippase-like domain-containing protein [Clostridia bacterium]